MNLSTPFIERPVMTLLVMLSILFFGVISYEKLPVSDMPNINYPAITVTVNYPGADPETMAATVVSPLEKQFQTIQGVESLASSSTTGNATIVLQFSLKRTIDSCALDVEAAINEATPQLPQDLPYAPTYSKVNPSQTPVLYYAVTSNTTPLYDLYDYAYTEIGQKLSTISGVAQIVVFGQPFAVRVQVDPQKLAAKKIGIDDVAKAIQEQNPYLPTGSLFGKEREYSLRVKAQMESADLYNQTLIKTVDGAVVRVSDVGRALNSLYQDKQYFQYATADERSNTVVFGVQTQPGVNTLTVIDAVHKKLPLLQKNLPKAVQLKTLFDKSQFIHEAVSEVQLTLLIAIVLVIVVIFLFLGKLKETVIPGAALPLTIFGTFAIMVVLGYTIDILSLLAITLSVGFLVDDAIVVLENIIRLVEKGMSPKEAAIEGSKKISVTIVSMTLSLASIFIPLLFMGGVVGLLFHEFSVVIIAAVLLSGFVSLSLTPMLASRFIPPLSKSKESILMQRSKKLNEKSLSFYRKTLHKVLKKPLLVAGGGALSLGGSLFLLFHIPADFLPPDDIGFIIVHSQASDGTSPFRMVEYQKKLTESAQKNEALDSLVSLGGIPTDNKGIIFFRLKERHKRGSMDSVIDSLQKEFNQIPGVATYLKPMPLIDLQVSTQDINAPYQYVLQGFQEEELYPAAEKMLQTLKGMSGLKQVSSDLELSLPQLKIEILRDKASVLNLSARSIETALQFAYGGVNLTPINEQQNQYFAILETLPKFYRDPEVLSDLYLRSAKDRLIPLTSVIKSKESLGAVSINRINGQPSVNIFFDLNQIPLGEAIAKISEVAEEVLPPTITGAVQGTASAFQASFSSLYFLLMITLFIVYVVLGILYEDFIHPITVMSTIPPAALGGFIVLYAFQEPLSLYAVVGFILLLGIVLKNGIILIDFAIEEERTGKSSREAITLACEARFRPILMTTASALMGAVPIALGIGGATALSRRPLGLVIVGGLIISQIITLYLTPALYVLFDSLKKTKEKH